MASEQLDAVQFDVSEYNGSGELPSTVQAQTFLLLYCLVERHDHQPHSSKTMVESNILYHVFDEMLVSCPR